MQIGSIFTKTTIELQRIFDHLWLSVHGMPNVNRSMLTKNLYLGGQYSVRKVSSLKKLGITAIVNMRKLPMQNQLVLTNFKLLQLPTSDLHAPTLDHLREGVKFIDKEIKNGGSVYVHCRYGEGRGPSMAISYLMYIGMTLDEAIAYVRKVRPFIRPTLEQIDRLKEFEQELRNSNLLLAES
jgi:protein-tyrosine phosphatase